MLSVANEQGSRDELEAHIVWLEQHVEHESSPPLTFVPANLHLGHD